MSSEAVVYIVDTDSDLRGALYGLLETYAIPVQDYENANSFLEALNTTNSVPGCLMLSLDLPDIDSISLVRQLRSEDYRFPIIVLAASVTADLRQQLKDAGATELVEKYLVDAYIFTRFSELLPGAVSLPSTPDSTMELKNGASVTFRMMHPEDGGQYQDFVRALSERSRYLRFFSGIKELPPYMLKTLTHPDFPLSYALIAVVADGEDEIEVGVGRYAPTEKHGTAEFAVVVADDWQGLGIASQLLRGVITAAAAGGIERLVGLVLRENIPMLSLVQGMGFTESPDDNPEPGAVLVVRELQESTGPNDVSALP